MTVPHTNSSDETRFARSVSESLEEVDRLQVGVEMVVEMVPGCDHAGVTIVTKAGVDTDAATSELVWLGDRLQYELQEGPCLDAVVSHGAVISNDIVADPRWPVWGRRVADELGVRAMMSVLLFTGRGEIGALNMYAEQIDAYTSEDLSIAEALAAHLALAVAASREIAQRGTAMINRTVIGQAEGILMQRYSVDAARAFDVLRRISQNSNRKLTEVAAQLVADGDLAELHGAPRRTEEHAG